MRGVVSTKDIRAKMREDVLVRERNVDEYDLEREDRLNMGRKAGMMGIYDEDRRWKDEGRC